MKIPKIEIKLDRDYCLYDFLSRLSYYGPYEKERSLYSEKLGKIRLNFFEFVGKNRGKDYKFFIKNVSKFNNVYFRKAWKRFFPILNKQYAQIKEIIEKEGKTYLKKILELTKIKDYQYKKIIVFLSFPKITQIKPGRYGSTGSSALYNGTCVVYVGLRPHEEYKNANNLYVLWHEIIHTLDLPRGVWQDINECITELYEDLVCKMPKERIRGRISMIFKKYPRKLREDLVKTSLNWNWKRKDMLQLKFELAKKYKSYIDLRRG